MTTDAFHVKLDDDHFYGILQIELAYIYIYILVFKEDESGRFFVRFDFADVLSIWGFGYF